MSTTNDILISAEIRILSSTLKFASAITNLLKLRPSKTLDKGEFLEKTEDKFFCSGQTKWILESTTSSHGSLQEHIQELVGIIEKHSKAFQSLEDCQSSIYCRYYSSREKGISFFNTDIIKQLPKLPINLGIGVYYTFSDKEK